MKRITSFIVVNYQDIIDECVGQNDGKQENDAEYEPDVEKCKIGRPGNRLTRLIEEGGFHEEGRERNHDSIREILNGKEEAKVSDQKHRRRRNKSVDNVIHKLILKNQLNLNRTFLILYDKN